MLNKGKKKTDSSGIKYKIIAQSKAGMAGGGEYLYYPRVCNRSKANLRMIANQISVENSFGTSDVVGIIDSLLNQISRLLLSNHSVELGDFGNFSLHIKASGSASEKEVNPKNFKDVKVAFRPGLLFKEALAHAQFDKVHSK